MTMNCHDSGAGRLSTKVGCWSAALLAFVLIAYTLSMTGLVLSHPARWTGLSDYVAATSAPWHRFLTVCEACVFLAAPLVLVLTNCILDQADGDRRFLAGLGVCFAVVATVLGSINYFVQLGPVRQSIEHGEITGLEQFVQVNTHSVMYSLAILGWTVFLGLSSLFTAPVFGGRGLGRMIRWSFLVNGFSCMLGALGYFFEVPVLDILYLGGMGTSMTVLSISLAVHFQRRPSGSAASQR
jgi:hypothetical protein